MERHALAALPFANKSGCDIVFLHEIEDRNYSRAGEGGWVVEDADRRVFSALRVRRLRCHRRHRPLSPPLPAQIVHDGPSQTRHNDVDGGVNLPWNALIIGFPKRLGDGTMDSPSVSGDGIDGSAHWSLRLLGAFELRTIPGSEKVKSLGKREQALLAYLALCPNSGERRRKLATLLWCNSDDETAFDNLRTCLWRLRKALGDSEHRIVASEGDEILLDRLAFKVDALALRQLAVLSDEASLEAAADLCSGEFLDGLVIDSEEFESWRRAEAMRFRDEIIDVLTRFMTHLGERGDGSRAIEVGNRILRLEPLHDAVVRRLMQLYGESGRRGAAVELYRQHDHAVRTELNAKPEAETRAIFAEIVSHGVRDPAAADDKLPRHITPLERPNISPVADAKPPPHDESVVRSSATPPSRPLLTAFQLCTALAILAGVLIVTGAFISYRQFALFGTRQAVVTEQTASAPQGSAVSIAVLPFANLSGDANQEFLSDGMTEEITAALAKIRDLRVVGRTSAFQFKGQSRDLRAIGQSLGATYLIEGSVRKDGDRLRVTAQLVKADDGIDLWADSYDREPKDIFATQEDIAQAIAGALRVPLGLQQGEQLISSRTGDLDSFQQYLRARAMYRARALDEAIRILEPLVASDPGFAPAWALLARVYILLPNYSGVLRAAPVEEARRFVQSNSGKAEMAAREAIRLDSRYAGGYSALADIRSLRGKWAEAEDLYRQALSLDANDPDVLSRYGMMLNNVGRLKESLHVSEQLQMIEPFVPIYNVTLAAQLQVNGQDALSLPLLNGVPQDSRISIMRNTGLARAYATQGRFGEAADTLLVIRGNEVSRRSVEAAAKWIRMGSAHTERPEALPVFEGELNFVYAYVGAPDRVLEYSERGVAINYLGTSTMWFLWVPQHAPLRKTERFKTLLRNAGLVHYWRAKGWPDLCHSVGPDDFACE